LHRAQAQLAAILTAAVSSSGGRYSKFQRHNYYREA